MQNIFIPPKPLISFPIVRKNVRMMALLLNSCKYALSSYLFSIFFRPPTIPIILHSIHPLPHPDSSTPRLLETRENMLEACKDVTFYTFIFDLGEYLISSQNILATIPQWTQKVNRAFYLN